MLDCLYEIRKKNQILGSVHVIFNKVCKLSNINGLHLQFCHGNNLCA